MLLRGASAAVPAILTLQSGAALARSSNLIGANSYGGAENGKYNCLDFDGIDRTDIANVYDLGSPPMGHVTRIDAEARYYKQNTTTWGGGYTEVTPPQMCADGGTYVRRGRWGSTQVNVNRGVLVSATALGSFSSGINYTDV
ncbi:MAG: hypothetical protein AB7G76_03740 [Steroidobacteraceae bacterium]